MVNKVVISAKPARVARSVERCVEARTREGRNGRGTEEGCSHTVDEARWVGPVERLRLVQTNWRWEPGGITANLPLRKCLVFFFWKDPTRRAVLYYY